MNRRKAQREALDLSQVAAAGRAGVSLATWRRWEHDPDTVSATTRAKCERVLDTERAVHEPHHQVLRDEYEQIERVWKDRGLVTPRQAAAIQVQLDMWQDMYIGPWLEAGRRKGPLHTVSPFDDLDPRVMVHVDDNRAWAEFARRRCIAVCDEMDSGVLPFDRPGCFFDEVLMALALDRAEEAFDDHLAMGMFDRLAPHKNDADWHRVSDDFDDAARFSEWDIPTLIGHPALPDLLAQLHPFSWFDAPDSWSLAPVIESTANTN